MWTKGTVTHHLVTSEALPAPFALHLEIAALAELRAPGAGRARFGVGGPGQAEQEVGYATRLQSAEELARYADVDQPGIPDPAREEVWVLAAVHTKPRYVIVDGPTLRARLDEALAADPRAREPFAREKGAAPYLPAAARYDGVRTLAALADTCETCGGRATFTGRADVRGKEVYATLHCPRCRVDFPVWSRAAEPVLAAWLAATLDAPDRLRLRDALAVLRAGTEVDRLLAAAERGRRLPWLGIDEVRVAPALAERWLRLVLDAAGWVPAPTARGRIAEALAFVSVVGTGAATIAARVGTMADDDLAWAFGELSLRAGPAVTALQPVRAVLDEGRFPKARAAANRFPELDGPVPRLLRVALSARTNTELALDEHGLLLLTRDNHAWTARLDADRTAALFAQLEGARIGDIPQWPLLPGSREVTLSLGGGAAIFGSLADAAGVPSLRDAIAAIEPLLTLGDGAPPAGVSEVREA